MPISAKNDLTTEKGQFLALDLGESNLKVLHIKLGEGMGFKRRAVEIEENIFPIHKELLSGRAEEVKSVKDRTEGANAHRNEVVYFSFYP